MLTWERYCQGHIYIARNGCYVIRPGYKEHGYKITKQATRNCCVPLKLFFVFFWFLSTVSHINIVWYQSTRLSLVVCGNNATRLFRYSHMVWVKTVEWLARFFRRRTVTDRLQAVKYIIYTYGTLFTTMSNNCFFFFVCLGFTSLSTLLQSYHGVWLRQGAQCSLL